MKHKCCIAIALAIVSLFAVTANGCASVQTLVTIPDGRGNDMTLFRLNLGKAKPYPVLVMPTIEDIIRADDEARREHDKTKRKNRPKPAPRKLPGASNDCHDSADDDGEHGAWPC